MPERPSEIQKEKHGLGLVRDGFVTNRGIVVSATCLVVAVAAMSVVGVYYAEKGEQENCERLARGEGILPPTYLLKDLSTINEIKDECMDNIFVDGVEVTPNCVAQGVMKSRGGW